MKITVEVTKSELEKMDMDTVDLEVNLIDSIDELDHILTGFNVYIVIVDEVVN